MTNLRIFTDQGLDFIRLNMAEFYEKMKENGNDTKWIKEYCKKDPTTSTKLNFDFSFETNNLNQNEGDYYNAIRLYELFEANNIKEAWIYDEKFIAGFLLTFGYDYFIWYTQLKTETRVSATFFFDTHKGKRQAIARHLLTRLYKLVKMTINDEEDKYIMTKFVFDNPALRRMVYYPYMDDKIVSRSLVKGFMLWKERNPNKTISGKLFNDVRLWYSAYCAANLVEAMDINFVAELVLKAIEKYAK